MSWLLKRSRPRVLAGWRDDFNRPNENPARQPWGPWSSTGTAQVSSNRLMLPANFDTLGGWSHEYTAYTDHWGYEFDLVDTRPSGTLAQPFRTFIKDPWSRSNYSYSHTVAVQIQYRTSIAGGPVVGVWRFDSGFTASIVADNADLPDAWFNTDHNVKVWIDGTSNIRVFLDDVLSLACSVPAGYEITADERSCNFQNGLTVPAYLDFFQIFDRPHDLAWALIFAETFNRANGAPGNGWTQLGANAGIVSNSWATTGSTDGGRALIRDTGITSGACRIEGIIGGNIGVGSTQHSDLLLCVNGITGTQALAVRLNNTTISIGRYSASLTGTSPTFTEYRNFPYSPANGDIVGAALKNGTIIVDQNGAYKGFATGVHDVVPASNSWYGLRVKRQAFGNSFSWNDCNIFQAA